VWRRTVVKRRHVRQDLHPNVGGSHETSHAVLRQWRQKNDVIQLFSACPLLQRWFQLPVACENQLNIIPTAPLEFSSSVQNSIQTICNTVSTREYSQNVRI